MGTMAGHAPGAEPAVRALLLGSVAIGARFARRQALMGLMAIRTELMTRGRGLLFDAMAAGAGLGLRTGVRFVTARTLRVTGLD